MVCSDMAEPGRVWSNSLGRARHVRIMRAHAGQRTLTEPVIMIQHTKEQGHTLHLYIFIYGNRSSTEGKADTAREAD